MSRKAVRALSDEGDVGRREREVAIADRVQRLDPGAHVGGDQHGLAGAQGVDEVQAPLAGADLDAAQGEDGAVGRGGERLQETFAHDERQQALVGLSAEEGAEGAGLDPVIEALGDAGG